MVGVSAPTDHNGKPDRLFEVARSLNLPVLPAGRLNAETLPTGVDLIVAAHSHDYVGRKTRLRSRLGAIGYHPSLLPLHRGRDAIRWTLKMGDRVTGGTVFWLSDTVDGGPVAAQDFCLVRPDDTPESIWRRDLGPMGIRLFHQVLKDLERGILVKIPQDEALATWEPSWTRPPLYKPDLLQIGDALAGFTVVVEK